MSELIDVIGSIPAAREALDLLEPSITYALDVIPSRIAFHMVIIDNRVPYLPYANLPRIGEKTFGEKNTSLWKANYKDLAHRKVRQCWREQRSCRDIAENAPELCQKGDTKYAGGIIFNGLIIAGSGFPEPYDEAYSYSLAHLIWARLQLTRQVIRADDERIIL